MQPDDRMLLTRVPLLSRTGVRTLIFVLKQHYWAYYIMLLCKDWKRIKRGFSLSFITTFEWFCVLRDILSNGTGTSS